MVMAFTGSRQRPQAPMPTTAHSLQQALMITALLAPMSVAGWAKSEPPRNGYRFELTHVDAGRREGSAAGDAATPIRSAAEPNPNDFQYFAKFDIGENKKVAISAVVDTGSNLIWTMKDKCHGSNTLTYLPCNKCNHANCKCVPATSLSAARRCEYDVKYGTEKGSATGIIHIAQLTFQLASGRGPVSFNNVAVGCSSEAHFKDKFVKGILGLGRGAQSLQNQLKSDNFAYCLSAYKKPDQHSVLLISAPAPKGGAVVTTGLRKNNNPRYESFYFVQLEEISINGTQLPIKQQDGGNMFVDSGVSYTLLVKEAYDKVVDKVDHIMASKQRKKLPPEENEGRICYEGAPDESMPNMVLRFAGHADMVLPWRSYLWASTKSPVLCLALNNSGTDVSVLGNFQQQGMHMHFDLKKEELSFVRADDCSKV